MIRLAIALLAGVGGCFAQPPATDAKPACPAGEIIIHGDDPTTCNLIGGANTLTILDITEAACDAAGGNWWHEACLDADF